MKFESFNLKKEIVEIVKKIGFTDATPVQDVVIPKLLKNSNCIVKSKTGSGKTHAYLVPIINNLDFNKGLQAVIIAPTRELSLQIYNFIKDFKKYLPSLNCKVFTNGIDFSKNLEAANNNLAQIVVCTPGRLKAISENSNFSFENIQTIILDEVDMLSENDFFDDIGEFIEKCNENINIGVFSATINQKVEVFLRKYISPDYYLDLDEELVPSNINNFLVNTKHINYLEATKIFIDHFNPYLLFIFASKKEKVKEIYSYLKSFKYNCAMISGDLSPRERKAIFKRVKNNEFQIVVCSDIAARGIDVEDVSDVLSVDLPSNIEYFLHRIGRTGRMGKNGNSYLFYDNDHLDDVKRVTDLGIEFGYLKITNNVLENDKKPENKKVTRKKPVTELDEKIKLIKRTNTSKKVKPGYKKKVKQEIEKEKRRYKRKVIQQDIRRQMTERYKKEGSSR